MAAVRAHASGAYGVGVFGWWVRIDADDGIVCVFCRVLRSLSHKRTATAIVMVRCVVGFAVNGEEGLGLRALSAAGQLWALNQDVMSSLVRATCLCVR